ncbi:MULTISPECIES: hypothetical protein [Protofrankia]|uniref:Uncharacterized protein n=1 Tax=Protofrankia coriariae TaxID=1562887 RepID=A0ABR5EZT2_9ACTN|nr:MULTISPECIES: hypothetical protein [Protofrankia]KLL09981.1 hypothetical protein FrCorBMG51_21110 [Protofrankia coriariae]ONH33279.1 hypothetical protein BL254_20195 [Protofrankia sp. BMG5.30]
MAAVAAPEAAMTARFLVRPDVFDRLVDRVAVEVAGGRDLAVRIVDQTLAFLAASARNPGVGLAPSRLVDIGWHVFVLDTREYAAFCDQVAGRFIHHVPNDAANEPVRQMDVRARTLAAITDAGYAVDMDLWPPTGTGRCGSCADEGNCSASGKDGDENQGSRIPR